MREQEQVRLGATKEIPVDRPEFQKGIRDYQILASNQDLKPGIIVDGKEYLLEAPTLKGDDLDRYIGKFRILLQCAEKNEDRGVPSHVHLNEERHGHLQFLPVTKENIKTQLFGFGWAALEAKGIRIAFSALRVAEVLDIPEVVQRFTWLGSRDKSVESFLQMRREWEKAHLVFRSENSLRHPDNKDFARSLERTKKALKVVNKILTHIFFIHHTQPQT